MFPPKKILYPINLDSKKITLLNRIFIMARTMNASVSVLYVNDSQAGYRHAHKTEVDLKTAVASFAKPHLLDDLQISYHVRKGELGSVVHEFCQEKNIDLIVTGHKHHNRLYSAIFDTADESIIDSASIPVLIIPKNVAEEETNVVDVN